jgi:hypothetical protein
MNRNDCASSFFGVVEHGHKISKNLHPLSNMSFRIAFPDIMPGVKYQSKGSVLPLTRVPSRFSRRTRQLHPILIHVNLKRRPIKEHNLVPAALRDPRTLPDTPANRRDILRLRDTLFCSGELKVVILAPSRQNSSLAGH